MPYKNTGEVCLSVTMCAVLTPYQVFRIVTAIEVPFGSIT